MAFAVLVRYLGPTNTRGARFVATCNRGVDETLRKSAPYDYGAPMGEQPVALALDLIREHVPAEYYPNGFKVAARGCIKHAGDFADVIMIEGE